MVQEDLTHVLLTKIDGRNSFYFYSNSPSFIRPVFDLETTFSDLLKLEEKTNEYEELIRRFKEIAGVLEMEIDK